MAVARTHATKATEALAGATELDADVCDRMRTLVERAGAALVVTDAIGALGRCSMRRVDAWLAADLDAYMACWHDDMVIELPSGVIEGAATYRKLVAGGFAWAEPVSFDVHHLAFEDGSRFVFADWTIRARRREDGALSSGAACRCASFAATAGSRGGGSITSPRPRHRVIVHCSIDPKRAAFEPKATLRMRPATRRLRGWPTRGGGEPSISSRNRSTASLNAFGASAMRPCAAPRSTYKRDVRDQLGELLGVAERRERVLRAGDHERRRVTCRQLEAQLVGRVEDRVDLRDERVRLRLHRARARARSRTRRTGGAGADRSSQRMPSSISPGMPLLAHDVRPFREQLAPPFVVLARGARERRASARARDAARR